MKHTAIKSAIMRVVTVMLLLVKSVSVSAQYYQMIVHTDDGLTYPFNANRIDSVSFLLANTDNSGNDVDETTVTGSALDITTYSATITAWANILDNLSTDLEVGIIFTTTGTPNKNNGTQKTVSTSSIDSDAMYTIVLTDLAPSTTYYYRSFVYQSGIWFYGNVKEFTTKGMNEVVVSGDASLLTCYSAKVSGSISIDESAQHRALTYGICYGTNSNPTVSDLKVQANSKDSYGNYSCQIRALTGSTTYYYRAYVDVNGYLGYGSIRSFTTKTDDVVITGDIDSETFAVKSTLKIGGGAYSTLELGVCYGTNDHPTVSDKTVTTNEVDDENNFILTLKEIPYKTVTIYYCAFVKIDGVVHYGNIQSFERIIPVAEAVDLGLSVKWASFNVGASKPAEYGDYFAWGETEPKTNYSMSTYKWCNSSYRYYKYTSSDKKYTLKDEDDVAYVKWGGDWRMPTKAELIELRDYCIWTWYGPDNIEFGGVAGYKVAGKKKGYTDNFIFLPVAGYYDGTSYNSVSSYGLYWSKSLVTDVPNFVDNPEYAWVLLLKSDGVKVSNGSRYYGQLVRPVCP